MDVKAAMKIFVYQKFKYNYLDLSHHGLDGQVMIKRILIFGTSLVFASLAVFWFITFVAPNISPNNKFGIGQWTDLDFVNAMSRGISPEGEHNYPALPYTNYQKMPLKDFLDLRAFLNTLPAAKSAKTNHDLPFPISVRQGLGLCKLMYLGDKKFEINQDIDSDIERGRYLVQGPGHCGACHTPVT